MQQQELDDPAVQRRALIDGLEWAYPQAKYPFDYEQAGDIKVQRWRTGNSPEAITAPMIKLWKLQPSGSRIVSVAKAQAQWLRANDPVGPVNLVGVLAKPYLWLGLCDIGPKADPFTDLGAAIMGRLLLDNAVLWHPAAKKGHRCVSAVIDVSGVSK